MIPINPQKSLERSLRPTLNSTGKIQESEPWEKRGLLAGAAHPSEDVAVCLSVWIDLYKTEMCSERDSPLKRLYRRTHAKLTRLAGSRQLVWATGCELSPALIHARQPAWPGETSETILRVAPTCKTRPPDQTRVNWPVDASASGSAQVGPGGHHRWAARVQVGQEPARQKAREGYPSHYTSLYTRTYIVLSPKAGISNGLFPELLSIRVELYRYYGIYMCGAWLSNAIAWIILVS